MPTVKVEMIKGKSPAYKNALLDGIHKALVDHFEVPEANRIQRIYELDKENFKLNPSKTNDFVLIGLTVIKGRRLDVKKKLYKAIADNLASSLGIAKTDILITLNEVPTENWGVRGCMLESGSAPGADVNT